MTWSCRLCFKLRLGGRWGCNIINPRNTVRSCAFSAGKVTLTDIKTFYYRSTPWIYEVIPVDSGLDLGGQSRIVGPSNLQVCPKDWGLPVWVAQPGDVVKEWPSRRWICWFGSLVWRVWDTSVSWNRWKKGNPVSAGMRQTTCQSLLLISLLPQTMLQDLVSCMIMTCYDITTWHMRTTHCNTYSHLFQINMFMIFHDDLIVAHCPAPRIFDLKESVWRRSARSWRRHYLSGYTMPGVVFFEFDGFSLLKWLFWWCLSLSLFQSKCFGQVDQNGDGHMSFEEWSTRSLEVIQKVESNVSLQLGADNDCQCLRYSSCWGLWRWWQTARKLQRTWELDTLSLWRLAYL